MRHVSLTALVGLIVLLSACGQDPPPEPPPPPAEDTVTETVDRDAEAEARRLEEERARREAEAEARRLEEVLTSMVFFDYDASTIRPDQAEVLREKVPILRDHPDVRIRIAGHADERGSTEYNLALGERRARSVQEFLTGFGLAEGRFEIVSYGEEQPLDHGDDESAYARNRRAEFTIVAGDLMGAGGG